MTKMEITNETITNERIPDLEEIIWGFELARFDSHSSEYHRNDTSTQSRLKEQYEASLNDPRRI